MSLLIADLIKQKNAPSGAASMQSIHVTTRNFEEVVLQGSLKQLVLIDFWAPWCQPCKALEPILEKIATTYAQQIILAKVNIDAEPAIAMQFRIQSVPTVVAFHQGKPVDGFAGAIPESQLRAFVEKLIGPPMVDIPALLAQAKSHFQDTEFDQALTLYQTAWEHDPQNVTAVSGIVRSYACLGDFDAGQMMLARAPAPLHNAPEFKHAEQFIAYHATLKDILTTTVPLELKDAPEALYFRAQEFFFQHQYLRCFEQLLHIVASHMSWQERKAQKTLLELFDLLGTDHPLVIQSRKKLSTLLCQ